MVIDEYANFLKALQLQALQHHERRMVVLVGENDWAKKLLSSVGAIDNTQSSKKTRLIYGDNAVISANVSSQRFRDKLGSESDYVVFADSQFSIDALAALSGTLRAGGILFVLVDDYALFEQSLFMQRFLAIVNRMPEHVVLDQHQRSLPAQYCHKPSSTLDKTNINTQLLHYGCVTQEQVTAVEAIIKVLTGKRKQPLVLTADRGRGKSSALALACAQMLKLAKKDNPLHIVITAADLSSLQVFFQQLVVSLPKGKLIKSTFTSDQGCVEFIPVDQLLKAPIKASLVLVDEAAAIPVYLLEQLVQQYHRMVFASTVHGYEGAGRGFTLKFQQHLQTICPRWQRLHIKQAIRYRQHDPLERLIFDACLLDAPLDEIRNSNKNLINIDLASLTFKSVSAKMLIADEALLRQVVSVLVTAHYQTKPSDIKMLLENPHIQVLCLFSLADNKQQVVAVAMLVSEGKSSDERVSINEVNAISHAKRRLSNHFTPQSLLTQCGFEQSFIFHYLRVMRIAVHVQLQQQGIGSSFLQKINQFAHAQGADFLTSSFGATANLLSFWLKQEFCLARLGFSKDKASGEHSALVVKALNNNSKFFEESIQHEFYRTFDYLLTDEYKQLAAELVALVLNYCPEQLLIELSDFDQKNVAAYLKGERQYSCCVFQLHLFLKQQLALAKNSNTDEVVVLIQRIMQKHSVDQLCKQHQFSGKKALDQHIKQQLLALAN